MQMESIRITLFLFTFQIGICLHASKNQESLANEFECCVAVGTSKRKPEWTTTAVEDTGLASVNIRKLNDSIQQSEHGVHKEIEENSQCF